ncbi:LexA family protein [Acidithiobacillus caldus]|jgi:SOS-response transcriptional repressor LexA|nr:helix-turn-helix transcriptional regulator [Acidithiobacillus caldus]MBU2728800.1 helix-turn-helix transcriptional regulator [Acidithiobacillus caldus]MBU2736403.1 helix-turn-helix transcriptional regulator [Acidithiobacillus caldus ATCC 51756]MBU2743980.1 helix-turn-helix transcriptional regulator [Acidithiobacillus caldus]MBU2763710.1 helix-turn-helix transcriptional regulator [Acidithiobacillus caldus]MBU2771885.1 helix-turn-helix transcriptional regulator [Acidithiobacillus caldus]
METFSDRVRKAREHAGLSQAQLAERVGMSQPGIQKLERGGSSSKFTAQIASVCGVSGEWLATGKGQMLGDMRPGQYDVNVQPIDEPIRTVPLISSVAAGLMTNVMDPYALGAYEKKVPVLVEVSKFAFALRVLGNSMMPDFSPGDIIIIDPDVTPHPGDFVVAKNDEEEATFKKYRPRGRNEKGEEYFELVPLNPDYPILRSDLENIYIIGTVVQHNRMMKNNNKL